MVSELKSCEHFKKKKLMCFPFVGLILMCLSPSSSLILILSLVYLENDNVNVLIENVQFLDGCQY